MSDQVTIPASALREAQRAVELAHIYLRALVDIAEQDVSSPEAKALQEIAVGAIDAADETNWPSQLAPDNSLN